MVRAEESGQVAAGSDTPSFEADLRLSPKGVIAATMVAGMVVGAVAEYTNGAMASPVLVGLLSLWALSVAAWLLDSAGRTAGRWLAVLNLVILIGLLGLFLQVPASLLLLAIPTALAGALIGTLAAVTVAGIESLFLLLASAIAGLPIAALALSGTWGMVAIVWAVYHPVYRLAGWSWERFLHAQRLLDEARDRQGQLHQALADLAHVNQQLALTNERLAAARLAAEEAQKAKAAFVANVSHEFRTPLNMIIGLTDLLLETPELYGGELPATLQEDLEIVHRNCEHLAGMVNDVLDLSQVEAGRLTLHKSQVDLAGVIEQAVSMVQPLIDKKGLRLEAAIPAGLPEIHCDHTRVRQVIVNLLSNAARYTEKGGVAVRVVQQAQDVQVSVADTGPGIPPEDARRIFEPFYRGSRAAGRVQDGSGLGLSISRQFVELHDGRMWLDSSPGAGTTFHFSLPIAPVIRPLARPERWIAEGWTWIARTTPANLPVQPPKPHLVLWDETGEIYPLFSRQGEEVELIHTQDLLGTVQMAERSAARAIMVNSAAPGDLPAQVAMVREKAHDVPIVGFSLPRKAEQAARAGALAYLVKPVTRADLRAALERVERPVQHVLIVDDDEDARQLFARLLQACNPTVKVTMVATGRQALAELAASPPDLVLLDIVLPDIDGWQILSIKSRNEAIRDIPVILITARDPAEEPQVSPMLLATMGAGLSVSRLLNCTRAISVALLQPEQ